ncbi:MAG: hypothetical protein WAT61_15335 [Flavobacteriales bacterium]
MNDLELVRRLRRLRRTVLMLETELRLNHIDLELVEEIEERLEHGIATDPRSADLRTLVDALRESTMTPRKELMRDTVRAAEKLRDAVDAIVDRIA